MARPMVEVRLKSKTFRHSVDGVETIRREGEVFHIDRSVYEADIEPDRGMGVPAHGRTFMLISDEKATEKKKVAEAQKTQDRIAGVRESMRDQLKALEESRIRSKAIEAENQRAAAEALKPLEQPGAKRVA